MNETFTENDLIAFLYEEATPQTKETILRSMLTDSKTQREIESLSETMKEIDSFEMTVPKRITLKILEQAQLKEQADA